MHTQEAEWMNKKWVKSINPQNPLPVISIPQQASMSKRFYNLPKVHQLGSKCSDTQAYKGHFTSSLLTLGSSTYTIAIKLHLVFYNHFYILVHVSLTLSVIT